MMIMRNLTAYTPENNPYAGASVDVAFCRDSAGRDWYESQKLFASDTLKVCYASNGVIVQYAYDVSALTPLGQSVAEVKDFTPEDGTNLTDGTWVFNGTGIVKRTYSAEEIQQRAERQRQKLITTATGTISLWQSELLLGTIADDDKASLVKWIAYIKALQAPDFTGITDEASYNTIEWPESP